MACLVFLCDSREASAAAAAQVKGHVAVQQAVLNHVLRSQQLTPMTTGNVTGAAILQVWTDEPGIARMAAAGTPGLSRVYEVRRKVFVPPPSGSNVLKRMSFLERAAPLSPDSFQETWQGIHGPRVAAHAGALLGYCQNHVLDRSPDAPPCDGLTELWFPDETAMRMVLPPQPLTPEALTAHAGAFIGRITTFLLAEERLK